MKFPTIPHDFPQKTFREVFNRVLNVDLLEKKSPECRYVQHLGLVQFSIFLVKV